MKQKQPGYILVLTLIMISLVITLVTYLAYRSSAYGPYASITLDREKAVELALGGIEIARNQLCVVATSTSKGAQPTDDQNAKELLKTILPHLNKWQTFDLKKKRDGVKGTLQICIVCEDGKININNLYDFEKKKFFGQGESSGDMKKLLEKVFERIDIKPKTDLMAGFEKFLKDRQYKIQDVTELLNIKEFEGFKNNVFYEPLEKSELDRAVKKDEKRLGYITDIFTVFTNKKTLEPWLLSDSVQGLFGVKRTLATQDTDAKIKQALSNFDIKAAWATDWDKRLTPLYGLQFAEVPKDFVPLLSEEFEARIFSVLSYGKIGTLTQRLLAVLERKPASAQGGVEVVVKKLYWL